jgi:hypothetical protein
MKMTKKLKSAKTFYEEARGVTELTATVIREFQKEIQEKSKKIQSDKHLSTSGKLAKLDEMKREHGIEILKAAHVMKQKYHSKLEKARKAADAKIHASLTKPDEETVSRFTKSFNQFKVELMLTPRADAAKKKVIEFMSGIKDPWIANQVREEFAEVAGHVLSAAGPERAKYQTELAQLFDKLESDHLTPEIQEAREILNYAERGLEYGSVFSGPLYTEAVKGMVGKEFADHLNTPELFFEKEENATHKPDFVDSDSDYEEEDGTPVKPEITSEEAFEIAYRNMQK